MNSLNVEYFLAMNIQNLDNCWQLYLVMGAQLPIGNVHKNL